MDCGAGFNNAIKKFDYTDILGWSFSRYDKFMQCKRQYFYDYYSKYDMEYSRQQINRLKAMTGLHLEAGNIVHVALKTLLERLLKDESEVDRSKFLNYALGLAQKYCASKTFTEVYYGAWEHVKTDLVYEKAETCLTNFLDAPRYGWIKDTAITGKKNWIIEPGGFGETRINGLKAYCKVDFLFPVEDEIYIIDWKSGKRDPVKHRKQLLGYTAWAAFHLGCPLERLKPIVAYLNPDYVESKIILDAQELKDFSNIVKQETGEMYKYCKDIELNIPVDKNKFSKTDNVNICKYCNYRELCR